MFPFTFFASEDVSVVVVVVCAILAWRSPRRHAAFHGRLSLAFVGAGLLAWCVLVVTGVLGPSESPWDGMHHTAGHLLLPIVACPIGLWFGGSLATAAQRPLRFLPRLLALLLLGMCCFSNARTGYLGPSRVDPRIHPATKLRFDVFHQVVFPCYIGLALTLWFRRLLVARGVESSQVQPAEPFASAGRSRD